MFSSEIESSSSASLKPLAAARSVTGLVPFPPGLDGAETGMEICVTFAEKVAEVGRFTWLAGVCENVTVNADAGSPPLRFNVRFIEPPWFNSGFGAVRESDGPSSSRISSGTGPAEETAVVSTRTSAPIWAI